LLTGQPFAYDAFNCHSGSSHTVPVTPRPVSIIEGSYSLHPYGDAEYLALHAARAILRIQPQEQLRRILLRNGEALLKRFQNEWIPLENRYLEAYHTIRDDELILNSERHLEDEPDKGGCDL